MAAASRKACALLYCCALVLPPLASLWLVSAALLPRLWMTAEAFAAEHTAPLHEIHLLGALTVAVEPALAYAMALFVVVIAAVVHLVQSPRILACGSA